MNILEARVALRERPLLDVFDLALRFVAGHGTAYAGVTLAVVTPGYVVSLVLAHGTGWAWGWPFAIALSLVAQAPFTTLASRLVFEERVSVNDVLRASLRALPRVIAIRFTQTAIVVAGLGFFLLPAVWLATVFVFVLEVVVLERARVGSALARAPRLASTQSGDAFLTVLLLPLLHVVVTLLADFAGRSLLEDILEVRAPPPLLHAGGSALALLGFWLFVPFIATARFFAYLNFRTRSEGWDVQTRFAALAARARAGAAS